MDGNFHIEHTDRLARSRAATRNPLPTGAGARISILAVRPRSSRLPAAGQVDNV